AKLSWPALGLEPLSHLGIAGKDVRLVRVKRLEDCEGYRVLALAKALRKGPAIHRLELGVEMFLLPLLDEFLELLPAQRWRDGLAGLLHLRDQLRAEPIGAAEAEPAQHDFVDLT